MSSFSTPVPINLHVSCRITTSPARMISVFLSSVFLFHLALAVIQCSVDMHYNLSALVNGSPVCLEGAVVKKNPISYKNNIHVRTYLVTSIHRNAYTHTCKLMVVIEDHFCHLMFWTFLWEYSGCWQQWLCLCGVLLKGEVTPVHTMKVYSLPWHWMGLHIPVDMYPLQIGVWVGPRANQKR